MSTTFLKNPAAVSYTRLTGQRLLVMYVDSTGNIVPSAK